MNVASAMVEGAEVQLRTPIPALRPYLGCFWAIECTAATRLRTMPDGCAAVLVRVPAGAPPECLLVGPSLSPADRMGAAGQLLFGVRLRPGVAFSLTGVPICQLVDRRTRLADLLSQDAQLMEKGLAQVPTLDERFAVLEHFLAARLAGVQIDCRVQKALQLVEQSAGQVRMPELARQCRVSTRHLNRLMRIWVGFPAKRLARLVRFQMLLQRMERTPLDPAQAAAELAYFDQSHLANEVAQFAGSSPGQIASRIVSQGVADFSKTRCQ
jgi:AraC-like DNA-binding protein